MRRRSPHWSGSENAGPISPADRPRLSLTLKPGYDSVTTGNLAGIDLWLDDAHSGTLDIETNIVSGVVDLAALADDTIAFDGGGLGRRLAVYRLPETDWSRRVAFEHDVNFTGGADLPVYLRVTQADGHQAWSSPIYLIA